MNLLTTVIDLDAIADNTRTLATMAAPASLMAVVKADAYGHGAVPCARVMHDNGASYFGVATFAEALALRAAGIGAPILAWLWSPQQVEELAEALRHDITIGVPTYDHARTLCALLDKKPEYRAVVHIKVDTGLNRSGVDEPEWSQVFSLLAGRKNVVVEGIFSHLAKSDCVGDESIDMQAETLRRAIACAQSTGLHPTRNHLAASSALLTRPDLRFDMVRPGLALYGVIPEMSYGDVDARTVEKNFPPLRPAMTWCARVAAVKAITQGEGVSYGLTWTAPKDGYTALIPVGYADGLPRCAHHAGEVTDGVPPMSVTIAGHSYPLVGRVCMDQIVVDLGENPWGVTSGDTAILFGDGTNGTHTARSFAELLGTISFEVVCLPKGRTVRVYSGENSGSVSTGKDYYA